MSTSSRISMSENAIKVYLKKKKKVCICCASKNGPLINIKTCNHTEFLTTIIKFKIDIKNAFVCVICHKMLMKIQGFKQQVEDSLQLLVAQPRDFKVKRLHNFESVIIKDDFQAVPMETDTDVKMEHLKSEPILFKTEVKIEYDSSDDQRNDANEEVTKPVKNKKSIIKRENLYRGKLQTVLMTMEEMYEEREMQKKNEAYLKLPYKCEDCIIGFDHEPTLITHIEQRHSKADRRYECNICKSMLISKGSYVEHMRRHVKRVECMVCRKRYHEFQAAIQHYDENHSAPGERLQPVLTCSECGFTTESKRVYRYHLDKHRHQGIGCKTCGVTYVSVAGLRAHINKVHATTTRVYNCDQCGKSYKAKSGLSTHIKLIHTGDPTEMKAFCELCRTHYRDQKTLAHHLATHSRHVTDSDKKFICDECGAKYLSRHELKKHINWEHLKISHRCAQCHKLFKKESELRRHFDAVHLKKRPPRDKICHYCGRGFTTPRILETHIRTHTGERPLNCKHCPATFAHPAALYTHCKLLHKK